jgi:hypothetical protein
VHLDSIGIFAFLEIINQLVLQVAWVRRFDYPQCSAMVNDLLDVIVDRCDGPLVGRAILEQLASSLRSADEILERLDLVLENSLALDINKRLLSDIGIG